MSAVEHNPMLAEAAQHIVDAIALVDEVRRPLDHDMVEWSALLRVADNLTRAASQLHSLGVRP